MATAIQFPEQTVRHQTSGLARGRGAALRLVEDSPECSANGCEVVLSNEEYVAFRELVEQPPRVLPGLAAMLRERRLRRR